MATVKVEIASRWPRDTTLLNTAQAPLEWKSSVALVSGSSMNCFYLKDLEEKSFSYF